MKRVCSETVFTPSNQRHSVEDTFVTKDLGHVLVCVRIIDDDAHFFCSTSKMSMHTMFVAHNGLAGEGGDIDKYMDMSKEDSSSKHTYGEPGGRSGRNFRDGWE